MKTIKIKYILFLFILAGLLSCLESCSTLPPQTAKPEALSFTVRQQKLAQIQEWKLQGAIAIRTPQDSGSATLSWQQNAQAFSLSLFGPLGSNAVHIEGRPGFVSMQTSQGKTVQAATAEQLLYSQLGWHLPVSHLYYWVRGLPVPGIQAVMHFDAFHRLTELTQENWQLTYKQYSLYGSTELPTKIILVYPQLNIKLVIYEWHVKL